MAFPKFHLRKHLYYIGQNMSNSDLNSLKFLCTYHGVPKRQLEKMETAFELFCALESQDKIGYDNDVILRDLLATRHREHLLNKYPLVPVDELASDHGGTAPSPQEVLGLSQFLVTISDSLSHRDFKDIACFLFDPDVSHYSYQDIENMDSATFIFEKLIQLKIIGPYNLTALYQVLEVIGRNDLCQRIVEYLPAGSHAAVLRQRKLEGISLPTSATSSSTGTSSPSIPSMDTSSSNNSLSELVSPFSSRPSLGERPLGGRHSIGGYPNSDISNDHGRTPSAPPPQAPPTTNRPCQPQYHPEAIIRTSSGSKLNHWVPSNNSPNFDPRMPPNMGGASNMGDVRNVGGVYYPPQQMMQETFCPPNPPHVPTALYQTPPLHATPPPNQSLLHQLQAENQELKDVAAQQFQLVQDLIQQVEMVKRDTINSSNPEVPSYPMNKTPHGIALIIGNEVFQRNTKRRGLSLGTRNGCQSDVYNFSSCFGHLQYDVRSYLNLSSHEILRHFEEISKSDHTNYDSFVFCISTHGEDNNYIFGSDSERINIYNLITTIQSCPSLVGKPKLFFVQACRTQPTDTVSSDGGNPSVRAALNQDADIAIFWATTRFSSAYRSPRDGSWFVATIHKVFVSRAHKMDLVNMMYLVTDVIANMEGTDKESRKKARQCVEVNLQMRGSVRFLHT